MAKDSLEHLFYLDSDKQTGKQRLFLPSSSTQMGEDKKPGGSGLTMGKSSDTELEKVRLYNTKLTELDPSYSENLKLKSGLILIRLYLINPKMGSLYQPVMMKIRTQSGVNERSIPDPYPYLPYGVIVNFDKTLNDDPFNYGLERGQIVMIAADKVATVVMEGGKFDMRGGTFIRPDRSEYEGYMLITHRDIVCEIPDLDIENLKPRVDV